MESRNLVVCDNDTGADRWTCALSDKYKRVKEVRKDIVDDLRVRFACKGSCTDFFWGCKEFCNCRFICHGLDILTGVGVALLDASKDTDKISTTNEDEKIGLKNKEHFEGSLDGKASMLCTIAFKFKGCW